MKISDVIPKEGKIREIYCDSCGEMMFLDFIVFRETVSGISININGLPELQCASCGFRALPDRSAFAILQMHKDAFEAKEPSIYCNRNKSQSNFNHTIVDFLHDPDDYYYLPGLARQWDDGFLTPVFFNKDVLSKYDNSEKYRVRYASTTYGTIREGDNFYISFGINQFGKVIMWLGDIGKLPEKEQFYLRSENIESDHHIGSEFYQGQIDCQFTPVSRENALFAARSKFLEEFFLKYDTKIGHLEVEVLTLAEEFTAPIHDTDKEKKHSSDIMNKIYVESLKAEKLKKLVKTKLSTEVPGGALKQLSAILKHDYPTAPIDRLMMPFFVLYDLRIQYSHLGSKSGQKDRWESICDRLQQPHTIKFASLYEVLIDELSYSYSELSELISS